MSTLSIAAYLPRSRANGPGLRSVLWVQGCPFRCADCFNPDFLPFSGGQQATPAEVAGWMLAEAETEGVSFSGGEPFAQAAALAEVAAAVRDAGKSVLVFTGYSAAELSASRNPGIRRLLASADVLVAGRYQADSPGTHPLLSSANQQLVHLSPRYREHDFSAPRRSEIRIARGGAVTLTGFPAAGLRQRTIAAA